MSTLRPYQERAVAELRAVYASGKRAPVLVQPTGAGKTVIASAITRSATDRGKRVLFLVHRVELLDQSVAKLERAGVTNVRLIRADQDLGSPLAPVTVASIPTLTTPRWLERLPVADLVIVDECHHTAAPTWRRIADAYAGAKLLGMTATPQRSDGAPLGDIFDALVVGSTVKELTELGHLAPCRAWGPPNLLDSGQLALDPTEAYLTHADGRRGIVFCATIEHAAEVAEDLKTAGVEAATVHGQMAASLRAETLARFAAGELRVVTNVHVLTEGFDDPGAEVCILARKPQHAGTFLQMVGRVLRPATGKTDALLIDLCGSVLEHGLPDSDRTYRLDGEAISCSDRDNKPRQCPNCGAVFPADDGDDGVCPACGLTLPVRPRPIPRSVGVGVAEVQADNLTFNAGFLRGYDPDRVKAALAEIMTRRFRFSR
jgi:superfamily II DNA or RNA helicase